MNDILVKSFKAAGTIPGNHIVRLGIGVNSAALATSPTEVLIGVAHNLDTSAGDVCDVVVSGIPLVKAGAAFSKGVYLTVDANGRAVAVSGGTDRTIGISLEDASAGDLIPVLLTQA